ncbi:rhomboid-like protein [Mycobacterium sp. 236(2023)]|uniref:rhomboid-like protein n=1 Tax=Mycobacterium sp. 236(2023) TaxID=3038163 RepID=UPI002414E093|nr:rhomboid-like protein [Mycobacterium sp. 236(2023)]MDG4668741.1 hypothetical protein [Mycobacterium sp. 236(2023)]
MTRVRVTLCYAILVAAVTAVMMHLAPGAQAALIRHSSTNLHNLGHGRFGTLVGSAFVVDAGPIYLWLPGLVCLLAVAELAWGGYRLLIAAVTGHVGASLIVAAGLAAAVKLGWTARSVAHEPDVGMSYVAMSALGALTGALPVRWRFAWAGWWFGVAMVVAAEGPDFTDVGHILALTLGLLVSLRFGTARRWSVPTVVLLTFGAAFGYLVLTDSIVTMVFGAAWGALGALAVHSFARLRTFGDEEKGASFWEAPFRFRVTGR